MRRIVKPKNSKARDLVYKKGRSKDNAIIKNILLDEQKRICAYTETYFDRTSKPEIEHFNPTLKYTKEDSYQNYFLVKAQWNNEIGSAPRWYKHQPLIHPTDEKFEQRIKYLDGSFYAEDGDIEAENLIKYLKLDDAILAIERAEYIQRQRNQIKDSGKDPLTHFNILLKEFPKDVYFIRAIQEEFNIQLNL